VQAVQASAAAVQSVHMVGSTAVVPPRGMTWGMGSMQLAPPIPTAQPPMLGMGTPSMSRYMAGKITNLEELTKKH
jgi:hypothetical protein